MSLRGVRQLKELVVRYSDIDGSSKGVRQWIRDSLVDFARKNPEMTIRTELKRNIHPFLRGVYVHGNSKTICIKNLSIPEIDENALHLRNQLGRKVNESTISQQK